MFTIDKETNQMTIVMKDTASFDIAFGNYYLVTGDKVTFTVAKEKESQDPLIQKVLTEFSGGIARIQLSAEDTDLPKGSYYYDIQVDTGDGRIDTVVGPAKFKVLEGVTY